MPLLKSLSSRKCPLLVPIAVAIVLILIAARMVIPLWLNQDRTVISDDSIREEIGPVAKVTTYDYNFTQILFLTDSGNPFGFDNPVTSKRYLATIDGTLPIQVDANKIECKVTLGQNKNLEKVKIKLPHSYAGAVALDHSTVKKYVEDNGWLGINSVSSDDYNQLLKQAETDQVKKVEESGYLQKADERICNLIETQIHSVYDEDVKVSFEFIEE